MIRLRGSVPASLAPLTVLLACADPSLDVAERRDPVVYGQDDRQDVFAVADPVWRARATRSAMALVPPDRLAVDEAAGTVGLEASVYGEHFGLCEGQRFFEQLRLGRCSGTLVDTDLVLTAGHCVPNQARCDDRRFVFEWAVEAEGEVPTLTPADIYECAEIVRTVDGTFGGRRLDFAFIRLDRPPPAPYEPAPLRPDDGALPEGTPVTLIGFPNGLPVKVAANGAVVNPRADVRDFFEATVDAFGGNSGSGVYDDQGRLAGVLVRGEQDYAETDAGCDVVNVLDGERTAEEGAEDITYAARAVEDLCLQGYRGDHLCVPGDQTWCFPCEADADCRAGWTCGGFAQNARLKFCRAPCAEDGDCRADHACAEGGCTPRLGPACVGPDVWVREACGRNVAPVMACPEDQRCAVVAGEAACHPAPPGDRCGAPIALAVADQIIEGDLVAGGFGAFAQGSCAGRGPEVVYGFTLDRPRPFTATVTGFDTVLHLRRGCDDFEVACVDDSDPPGDRGSQIQADLAPGVYQLFVDSYSAGGAYTLEVAFGESPCEPVACVPGEARCVDDGVQGCAPAEGDGCPAWGEPVPCGRAACVDGVCVAEADLGPPDQGDADRGLDQAAADATPADQAQPDAAPSEGTLDQALADVGADAGKPDATVGDLGLADGAALDRGVADAGARAQGGGGGCRAVGGGVQGGVWALLLLALRRRRGTGR